MAVGKDKIEAIINNLGKLIKKREPTLSVNLIIKFVKYFFHNLVIDDVKTKNYDYLYSIAMSFWNFIKTANSEDSKIRVYNPNYEKDGWLSEHTIIEILYPDMPFLVDSLRRELNNLGLTNYFMIVPGAIKIQRDSDYNLENIYYINNKKNIKKSSLIYAEINKQTDEASLAKITKNIQSVLNDVSLAVDDWTQMRAKAEELIEQLNWASSKSFSKEIKAESIDFLKWLLNNNFTFIGCCDYRCLDHNKKLEFVPGSGLGFLSDNSRYLPEQCFAGIPYNLDLFTTYDQLITLSKSDLRSTVHRNVDLDYIGVKLFDKHGNIIGERRIIGLYTATAYSSSPRNIPFLRNKINNVIIAANLSNNYHVLSELCNILETFPRDDLFQISEQDLFNISTGILQIQERNKIKLFIREDLYHRFFSCFVFVPREKYTTKYRKIISDILLKNLGGDSVTFATSFSESVLARIHFIIKSSNKAKKKSYNIADLEQQIIDAGQSWQENLLLALAKAHGEKVGAELFSKYGNAFDLKYSEEYNVTSCVCDINHLENLSDNNLIEAAFHKSLELSSGNIHFKLFKKHSYISLSDILPILENLGMTILSENTYQVCVTNNGEYWIHDFIMCQRHVKNFDINLISKNFIDCFYKVWSGQAENDSLNKLIILSNLNWREISLLRAYTKYFRQIGLKFSEVYIYDIVCGNIFIIKNLVQLFLLRFSNNNNNNNISSVINNINKLLDDITNLDEDRILRRYLDIILATVRTNYFQKKFNGIDNPYFSFKFNPSLIPELPVPVPKFEIYVYSPKVEGVHLRCGKVARGGLRWSDRREDFRTEILGLMKAQLEKNSIIVPTGAKGGFICKQLSDINNDKEKYYQEVICCYTTFIKGLLDITDNIIDNKIIKPKQVKCLDGDDTYLVVAADKGTATFSDIANDISKEYNFWLGDAFASGGSSGYDHKKMGITAKGAWESVKRHFNELNICLNSTNISVVGIGDMSGDVFGNGMLLSNKLKLVAAFNHLHIFLDPNPDPELSYKERTRLFNLPRSSWADYDKNLISSGGGVYNRKVKIIKLSTEVKNLLNIQDDTIRPNELIKYILKAKVDLLWNGGIGTYIKSQLETNIEVGDLSNDLVRINGNELNCKVVGEGGNLGLTQLGRIEAALAKKIMLFTDFIDNSAGVDCSDHEVNIKILLNKLLKVTDMTLKQRNLLLEQMTEEVSSLVLTNNYNQDRALGLAAYRTKNTFDELIRYMCYLEKDAGLNRTLEFLPTDNEIMKRKNSNEGFTRPELSVLLAHSKINLKNKILNANLFDQDYFNKSLKQAFPKILGEKYFAVMDRHRLRKEIIATQISNEIVNNMGITFIKRLYDETGARVCDIVRAYFISKEIFDLANIYKIIDSLTSKVVPKVQHALRLTMIRLIRRSSRWLLRNCRNDLNLDKLILEYQLDAQRLWDKAFDYLHELNIKSIVDLTKSYEKTNLPKDLVKKFSVTPVLFSLLDILNVVETTNADIELVIKVYYKIGNKLKLDWFREQIDAHLVTDHWDSLSRSAFRDDIDFRQRQITTSILIYGAEFTSIDEKIDNWLNKFSALIARWEAMLFDLSASKSKEFAMFAVALRELLDVVQASNI